MSWRDKIREWLTVEEEELEEPEEKWEPELEVTGEQRQIVLESTGDPVDAVVEQLMNSEGVSQVEASRIVYYLNSWGDIRFRDLDPPGDLPEFFLSWYSAWFWFVMGFQVLVWLAIYVLPQSVPWIYLRYVSGAVYVLYVPGAVFIEALYPKRDELEDLERFALGVGLSLALVPLVGLVLNYTPWGIRLNPIFVGLTLLVVSLSFVAVYRKYMYFRLGLEGELS